MNFLKINAGESQIVTLTDNEVKEEKNQWGGWTYNHIVNLDGNLFTFSLDFCSFLTSSAIFISYTSVALLNQPK